MGGNPAMMVDPWGLDGDTPEQPKGSIENPYQAQAVEVLEERTKVPFLSFATDLFGPPISHQQQSPQLMSEPLKAVQDFLNAAQQSFLNISGVGTFLRDVFSGAIANEISDYGQRLKSGRLPNPLQVLVNDLAEINPVELVLDEIRQTAEDVVVLEESRPERVRQDVVANDFTGAGDKVDKFASVAPEYVPFSAGASAPVGIGVKVAKALAKAARKKLRSKAARKAVTPPLANAPQLTLPPFRQPSGGLVIGRGAELNRPFTLAPNEFRLSWPSTGSTRLEWKVNSGLLRTEMRKMVPIRDASIGDFKGMYLNAERNLLQSHGWTFDSPTGYWNPPGFKR